MDYSAEISGPTAQINSITQAITPADSAATIQSKLTPFDSERDIVVGHIYVY